MLDLSAEADGSAKASRLSRSVAAGLLLVACALLAYLPVSHAGFIWDDDRFLTENPLIKKADGLYRFWFTTAAPDYFPLTSSTLWLEWRLWGDRPLGYHLANVILHGLSAVLWWRVFKRLLPQCGAGAWVAAAVFALHPVNVESVAWITERKNTLAMVFFVLTLLWYLRAEEASAAATLTAAHSRPTGEGRRSRREGHWYLLSLIAFALALLSKTAVAPLSLVLIGLAWWRRGRVTGKDLRRIVPFFAAATVLGLVTVWFQYHRNIASDFVRADGIGSRLAAAGWAVWFYLYKLVLPFNLAFVYPKWTVNGANPFAYIPLLLLAVAFVGSWRLRARSMLLAFGCFVVMLLPVLGFVNIYFMRYSLVADHWQYFAMPALIALFVSGFASVRPFTTPAVARILSIALLLLLGGLTWRQARIYRDNETLWQATLALNPKCYLAHNNLGLDQLQKGQAVPAAIHFQQALNAEPDDVVARGNLGLALLQLGQPDEAIVQFLRTLQLQPNNADARVNLGNALVQKGQVDQAMAQYRAALKVEPNNALASYDLAKLFARQGNFEEAIAFFNRTLGIQPTDVEARLELGEILLQKGSADDAVAQFRELLRLRPDDSKAHNDLGTALQQQGRAREAVSEYEAALKLQPNDPGVLSNLAWVLATCPDPSVRDGPRAVDLALQANRRTGGSQPATLGILAAACAESRRFAEAISTAEQALRLSAAQNNSNLVKSLQAQIDLYRAGSPLREAPRPSASVPQTTP